MSISSENVKYQKSLVSNFDTLLTVLPDRLILPFWESNVTKIACSKSHFISVSKDSDRNTEVMSARALLIIQPSRQ